MSQDLSATRPFHLLDTDTFAGTEQHVLTLVRAQAKLGLAPTVVCRHGTTLLKRAAESSGVRVVGLPGSFASLRSIVALFRATSGGSADLLHAHNGRCLFAGAAIGAVRKLPLVATQHFLEPHYTSRRGISATVSNVMHHLCELRTRRVLAISKAVRDRVVDRGECRPELITVVPNGVADPQSLIQLDSVTVRTIEGISNDAPLIVCAARLEPEKGLETLIRAMSEVVISRSDAVCIVAGRGSQKDMLQHQIESAGLNASFRLVGFREDVLDLINAADLFVLPSPAEPFGLVLLEAMGLHKPVIACAAGGPSEIVDSGRTGWLVAPGDARALAATILHGLGDHEGGPQMQVAARARYEQLFTDDRMAVETARVYDQVLQQRDNNVPVPALRRL